MNRILAVTSYSLREAFRIRAWSFFLFGVALAVLLVFMQFPLGFRNPYAVNIISSFFFFWSWGVVLTILGLGGSGIANERQAQTMFTLPIDRWQLFAGKLLAIQLLSGLLILAGYGLSSYLAIQQGMEISAYSRLGLATALAVSFICVCVALPLGSWLSPASSALIAFITLMVAPVIDAYAATGLIGATWATRAKILLPWGVDTMAMNNAFYNHGLFDGYARLGWGAAAAFLFFLVLTSISCRCELSMKSK